MRDVTPVYAVEPLTEQLWQEMAPLLVAHYDEIAHYKDLALSPAFETYHKIATSGALRIYSVRAAGELIGYSVWLVSRSLHYSDHIYANEDVLYLSPAHRGGRVGVQLMRYAHDQLRSEGVTLALHHCKHAAKLNLGPIYERLLGCEHIDDVWGKRLDR